jgi:hypothetical protein
MDTYINTIILSLVIVILIGVVYGLYNNYNNSMVSTSYYNKDQLLMLEIEKLKNKNLELEKDIESISQDTNSEKIITPHFPIPNISDDLLTMYDRKTTFDPLYEPTKRPPRHVIMPILGNPYFNYPTRGFTDSYSLKGYLIKDKNHHKLEKLSEEEKGGKITENQILKLFGREKFPNSIEYEYYVMVNTGFDDKIKYFLENQSKELYDGDNVYIDILQSKYRVKLLKDKSLVYNPYFL